MAEQPATLYVDFVENCSSCGGDHVAMVFDRLSTPLLRDGQAWSYGARCPETGEMIYLTTECVTSLLAGRKQAPTPQSWNAVIEANGRREGVYSVMAGNEDEARAQIERELAAKPHRQALLANWIDQGRMVRLVGQRRGKGASRG